jgi:hypothetical protein
MGSQLRLEGTSEGGEDSTSSEGQGRDAVVKPGATGEFSDGKIGPNDEGDLICGVATDPETGLVHVNFGKPIAWIAMRPVQARGFALLILEHVQKALKT